jgi:GTP-binding protein HflX
MEVRRAPERAILAGLEIKGAQGRTPTRKDSAFTSEESMAELAVLTASAGAIVEDTLLQARPAPDAATLIGSGKLEELREHVRFHAADLVVFDSELTPTQLRNLERILDCRVVDRTQLILDIFARRARTREGQLQVELAQLNYLLPRLTGRGAAMSRLGGGIGTRGPGETQLETDRRRIYRRLKKLEENLEAVRSGRSIQRRQRQSVPLETVALAGYTNAGKSTLFNRLTGAEVAADARMFATLDPTVRHIVLPSRRKALLSDTVGFIRNLPTTLVKAFRATLEEVVEASLILHVVDASSPVAAQNIEHVEKVLAEIGAGEKQTLLVLNKIDAAAKDSEAAVDAIPGSDRAVRVSARTGEGIAELLAEIDKRLSLDPMAHHTFRIPAGDGNALHLLHERARVTATRYSGEFCEVEADAPESLLRKLEPFVIA